MAFGVRGLGSDCQRLSVVEVNPNISRRPWRSTISRAIHDCKEGQHGALTVVVFILQNDQVFGPCGVEGKMRDRIA